MFIKPMTNWSLKFVQLYTTTPEFWTGQYRNDNSKLHMALIHKIPLLFSIPDYLMSLILEYFRNMSASEEF